jgi:aspartate 1-decarboxylase
MVAKMRRMFKSKLHRVTIIQANLDYEGSVAIDITLMDAADILPHGAVDIWNVTRGTRLTTYAIEAPRETGMIAVNGAAAHLNQPGDIVILATFTYMREAKARVHKPTVVFVDDENRIVEKRPEQLGHTPARTRSIFRPRFTGSISME